MLVLVILAAIWAAVLVPPYLQNRRETRPGDSIATFRTQLSVLERTTPGGRASAYARADARYATPQYAPVPTAYGAARRVPQSPTGLRRAEARRRRRDVFLTLLGAVGVTFVLAVSLGGAIWMLHLLVDAAFAGYVALLVKIQQESVEKDEKVRYLRPAPRGTASEPQLLLRRSGS